MAIKFKALSVYADSVRRDLAQVVDTAVNSFLSESKNIERIIDIKLSADFGAGMYGKALVGILYEAKEEEKKGGKK